MEAFLDNFHFLRPGWLLLLVPLALLWWGLRRRRGGGMAWSGVCDPHLLPWLLVHRPGQSTRTLSWLLALGWLLAVLALAGPTWSQRPEPVLRSLDARVIALDLSRSMLAEDLKPNRLVRARFKVADSLARLTEGQVALIGYAGDAFTIAPLTDDTDTITALLQTLEPGLMPVQGSRADRALSLAASLLTQAGLDEGEILLVADNANAAALEQAARLREQGIRTSVLGVGTPDGAPIPEQPEGFVTDARGQLVMTRLAEERLQALARGGGGAYARIRTDGSDLAALLRPTALPPRQTEQTQRQSDAWRDQGPWLLVLLLPLAALAFRRGWLLVLPLSLFLALPRPAQAFGWTDLWRTADQQASQALNAGHAQQAMELARDPWLAGTAAYRAGDYEQAAQAFARLDSADGHYNRGNALALDPDMEDAAANRRVVEERLRRRQRADQSSQSGQNQQQQQSQSPQQAQGQQGEQPSRNGEAQNDEPGEEEQAGQEPQARQDPSDEQQPRQDPAPTDRPGDENQQEDATAEAQPDDPDGQDRPQEDPVRQRVASDDPGRQEDEQVLQQWLRRIPDDPGGLLRRKFLQQYRQRDPAPEGENW